MSALAIRLGRGWPNARWSRLSLAARFAAAAGAVLLPATLAIGAVVTSRIEAAVVHNAASASALYVDSVIAPVTQALPGAAALSPGARRALEEVLASTPLGERVASFKLWAPDGRVVWAENEALVGRTFPVGPDLARALAGEVVASFDELDEEESRAEAALGVALLEIYSPVREAWSGRVVAVAEFYEVADALARDLGAARTAAWGAVAATTLLLGGVLTAIVRGGSRTIEAQARALDARLHDLRELSARNHELRLRVQAAAARTVAAADRTTRRIGADLHDGPAQHLAFAALRLDALRARGGPEEEDLGRVADAVAAALAEVRALSRGLQAPDVAGRPLPAVVAAAVEAHRARSGHAVRLDADCPAEGAADPALRLCAYRFVQEALANASRHGGGVGIEVRLACQGGELRLAVLDRGPGLPDGAREGAMGLAGLRDRVESLGGAFAAGRRPGGGTEVAMTIDLGA